MPLPGTESPELARGAEATGSAGRMRAESSVPGTLPAFPSPRASLTSSVFLASLFWPRVLPSVNFFFLKT